MTRDLKITLIILLIFQLLISCGFELAHDEAYYWLFSKHLDWGYFDHPPLVALIIKIFSFLPNSEFTVRIGFILSQFGAVLILLNMTSYSLVSLLLFFSFPIASFAGIFALPDTPLLLMTAAYTFQLKKYLECDSIKNSIILSIIISFLIYAKYHGILLIFFTLLAIPKLFLKKSLYLITLLSALMITPHIWWQYQHGFPTLQYQLFDRPSAVFSFERSITYLTLEIFLAGFLVGPILWFIILKQKTNSSFERALKFISIGTILFFFLSSFSKKIEANWSVFLTIPIILLTYSSTILKKQKVGFLVWTSFLLTLFLRIILVFPPSTFAINRLSEFHGWRTWARKVELMCDKQPILANSYQIASKLSYYLNKEVGSLNYRSRKNHFDFWRFDLKNPTNNICYITDKSEFVGNFVVLPNGKTMRVVKNESLERLWELKLNQR
jgi:hypothetical protein